MVNVIKIAAEDVIILRKKEQEKRERERERENKGLQNNCVSYDTVFVEII